jgi:hypothetical protein
MDLTIDISCLENRDDQGPADLWAIGLGQPDGTGGIIAMKKVISCGQVQARKA